ncbi:ATP-binding protein [Kineococcus sp. SYSU DK003]|uniref:hypothetical protein n=1 Tax=Kineococcus sp. SYSU DK003 TaxID=3383124 RepID=UPI003D7E3F0A
MALRIAALTAGEIAALPAPTRRALLLLAVGADSPLAELLAAATRLGLGRANVDRALHHALVQVDGDRVDFRHALVRAQVLAASTGADVAEVHRALAGVTRDPTQAAWHRAAVATGPDQDVAGTLEDVAARATRHGARAEAVRALRRAAELSGIDSDRARLLARAAETAREAGQVAAACDALREGFALASDPAVVRELAVTEWVLGYTTGTPARHTTDALVDLALGMPRPDRSSVLLAAAARTWVFETDAAVRARVGAALGPDPGADPLDEVARQTARALLDPVATGSGAGALLRTALPDVVARRPRILPACAFAAESAQDLATAAAYWDAGVEVFHAEGAVTDECLALAGRAGSLLARGRLAEAAADAEVGLRNATDLGLPLLAALNASALARLGAWRGERAATGQAAARARELSAGARCLVGLARTRWATGLLDLLEEQPAAALRRLHGLSVHPTTARWAVADLAEAAVAVGDLAQAEAAVLEADHVARATGSLALQALVDRARGFLAGETAAAGAHFAAAVSGGERAGNPLELARSRLAYGRWLRARGRTQQGQEALAQAAAGFERCGAVGWAARARHLA